MEEFNILNMNEFYLAHNKVDIFHYGKLQENEIVTTGQPFLEYFQFEQELIDRVVELGQIYQIDTLTNE